MFTKRQLAIKLIKTFGRAAAFVIIASTFIYILGGQIAKIGQTAKENRTAVTILGQKSQVTTDIKNYFALIGDGDKKVEEAFVKAENIMEFITKLEKTAKANDLEQNLKFGSPVPMPEQTEENKTAEMLKLMKVDYDIGLKGKIAYFNRYLKEFEKLPYFSSITAITINSAPTTGWEKEAVISVKAQLYLRQ